jgi:hypothetical protein
MVIVTVRREPDLLIPSQLAYLFSSSHCIQISYGAFSRFGKRPNEWQFATGFPQSNLLKGKNLVSRAGIEPATY